MNLWREVSMSELAADKQHSLVIGPFGSDLKVSDYRPSGIPVVFVKNVRPNAFDGSTGQFVSDEKATRLSAHAVRSGDLVITKMGFPPCVAAVYPEGVTDGVVTADIIKMSPDRSKVNEKYLVHFLNSPEAKARIARFTFGQTRPKVTLRDFKELTIPLPPLEEQSRIAAILDRADAIRRKRQEAIELTAQLLRSTFLEMFGDPVNNPKGWPTVTLASLILEGPTNGLYRPASDYGEGVPIVRIDSFHGGQITDLASLKRVNVPEDVIRKFGLSPGQILVNRVNSPEHLGKAALVPCLSEPTVFESNMMRLTVNPEGVCPEFLIDQLASHYIKSQIERCRKDASNQSSINQDDVGGFEIRLPPIKAQYRYRDTRFAMHAYRTKLRGSRVHADNLFNSLVQRAFTGQL